MNCIMLECDLYGGAMPKNYKKLNLNIFSNFNKISMRITFVLLLTLIIPIHLFAQEDSIKFGPIETMKVGTNYYNYSDKDKANIEVLVLGGVKNPGVYLIPQGKTLMELLTLTGGALDETNYENFKFIRTKYKNPELKADSILVLNYRDFFDRDVTKSLTVPNPILNNGDIIAFPIKPEKEFWDYAQRIAGVFVVPLFTIATLILQIINLSK